MALMIFLLLPELGLELRAEAGPALSADDCLCAKLWHALSGHASASFPLPFPSLSLAEQARQPRTAQACSSANSPGGHLHSLKAGEP